MSLSLNNHITEGYLLFFFDSFKLVAYIDEQSLLRNVLLCYLHRGFDYGVVIALSAAGQLVPIHDACMLLRALVARAVNVLFHIGGHGHISHHEV